MTWIKKIEPLILNQSSEIPYVILEDGVKLCFDNLYHENNPDKNDHNIAFRFPKNLVKRQSANYYVINSFPITIPFSDVVRLDDTIIEGRIIKSASVENESEHSICIIKQSYLDQFDNDEDFQGFVDSVEDFDKSFILVDEEINPQVYLFEDIAENIFHNSWGRTCTAIANNLFDGPKKYCWTHRVGNLEVSFYGMENTDEMRDICNTFESIEVPIAETRWEG